MLDPFTTLNPLATHNPTTAATAPTRSAGKWNGSSFSPSDLKKQVADPVENLIVKYPGAALASAFFVGVLVAWLIKRK